MFEQALQINVLTLGGTLHRIPYSTICALYWMFNNTSLLFEGESDVVCCLNWKLHAFFSIHNCTSLPLVSGIAKISIPVFGANNSKILVLSHCRVFINEVTHIHIGSILSNKHQFVWQPFMSRDSYPSAIPHPTPWALLDNVPIYHT